MTTSSHILLLGESETALSLDRKVLRRLGITQCAFFSSGRSALEHLLASGSSMRPVLICNERLKDITGLQFLTALRATQKIAHIPAVLLVNNAESPLALAARATNSCAVLSRPYSPEQAANALSNATLPEALHAPLVLPASYTGRLSGEYPQQRESARSPINSQEKTPPHTPDEISLRNGIAALRQGDVRTAEKLLHTSYKSNPERVETMLALSRLSAFFHRENEALLWLCRAGAICLKHGETMRAASIFTRLPRGKAGQTPLLAEAERLLQQGESRTAALCFLEAHRLDPGQPLHTLIGRRCMFTPAPEMHMRGLLAALVESGHAATATRLGQRLLQEPREPETHRAGFLEQFPLLCDIVSIAAHTFKTWRHAA